MLKKRLFIVAVPILLALAVGGSADAQNCGGGTVCQCGDNVTANRTLTTADPVVNTVCSGNGLVMNTPGVTLNLNGLKLVGSATGVGIVIAADGVTVRNGGVDNFQTGIGTSGSTTGSTIESVRPNANKGDGFLIQGNGNDIINIPAKRNGANGVRVVGSNNTIQGHNDEYNGLDGLRVEGDQNDIIANLASENAKTGTGNGLTVVGNGNVLERNRITKLNVDGIVVIGDDNTLFANKATKQKRDGISVDGDNNVLTENSSTNNKGVGFIVVGSGNPGASNRNVAEGNRTAPQCSIYGVTTAPTCIIR